MKNIIKAGNYILKKERGFVWACFCALLLGSAFSILPYGSNEEIQLMYNGILQNIAFTNCVISLVFINVCISKLYSEKNLYSFLISGHKRAEVISGISMVVISRSFFADSSYMLSFSVLCSCVCSRLISPSVSSWHKQDNTLMHQSPGHIQRRTPYNF